MTDPHKQMGRTLAKARAELDDINRQGMAWPGDFPRKHDTEPTQADMAQEPWIEPKPEPVWPMLLTVAACVALAFAIGYGLQSFWMEGM